MAENTEHQEEHRREVPRVVEAIASVPWAITGEALDTIVAVATRENEQLSTEALEAFRARRVNGTNALEIRNGVAIIRAKGAMFRYSDFFSSISGATNYQSLAEDAQAAADNPDVRSILAFWDSPGGEVNGCAELAEQFRAIAGRKPFESYVGGQCCSAAFWLASSTSKITIASTAMIGSLGVRVGIRDSSERDAKSGVKSVEFISSNAPNKRTDWSTDEGRARIQRTADQLEGVFLSDVARYRGVSLEDVIANYAQGGVEIGQDAVKAGMADALGSFETTIARLANGQGRQISITTQPTTRSVTMSVQDKTFTQAEHDAAIATASTEASTAASKRVENILDSEAGKKRPKQARHLAFKTGMDAEACISLMEASAEEVQTTATAPQQQQQEANANGGQGGQNGQGNGGQQQQPQQQRQGGERSQDAAGGLAMGTLIEEPGKNSQKPAAAINPNAIYANRAKQMGQAH